MDILTNVSDTTNDMCFIMNFFGSDKGHPVNDSNHCYTRFYHELFKPVRYEPLRVFELGLGTNNPNFPSNMGPNGKPGASLRGWKQYFPNASVFGADIDSGILFQEDRIRTYQCDQNDANSIKTLWSNSELEEGFNIIIEDGLHIFESNVHFFENSYHKLKVGGIFIIEDVMYYTLERWNHKLQEWTSRFPNMSFRLYVIPHDRNRDDNTVVVAKRNY